MVSQPQPVVVRFYRAMSHEAAAEAMAADAAQLAQQGYVPVSQSWAPGSWGPGAVVAALLLILLVIGVFLVIYMVLVKPPGALIVTYEYRAGQPT